MANIKRGVDPEFERFKIAVGRNIQKLRKEKSLTQVELSDETEINRTHISKIENGHKDMNLSTLYRLASEFGVQPSSLLDVDF